MEIICDFQGYCVPYFVVKEVAILSRDGKIALHFIVKPPFSWQQLDENSKVQVDWLRENHHGFSWNSGYVTYQSMENIISNIFKSAVKIYVKGDVKKKFASKYFSGLIEDLTYLPSLKKCASQKSCFFHASSFTSVCSLNNVHIIKELLDDKVREEVNEKFNKLNIRK